MTPVPALSSVTAVSEPASTWPGEVFSSRIACAPGHNLKIHHCMIYAIAFLRPNELWLSGVLQESLFPAPELVYRSGAGIVEQERLDGLSPAAVDHLGWMALPSPAFLAPRILQDLKDPAEEFRGSSANAGPAIGIIDGLMNQSEAGATSR